MSGCRRKRSRPPRSVAPPPGFFGPPRGCRALIFHLESKSKAIRDKAVIELLLYTGVRVSELVSIRIKDIDFLSHQLKVIGKGGKYREIHLKPEVTETIKKYLLERRQNPYYKSEYLLLGQRGNAINRILIESLKRRKLVQKLKPTHLQACLLHQSH